MPVLPAENGNVPAEGFFLVIGIGAGYHIKNLLNNLTKYCIVAVEADKESLGYCRNFPIVKEISENKNIILCSKENLPLILLQNYIPSKYGNFYTFSQRAWQNENPAEYNKIETIVKETLKNISNDFSVQAHFGKIWQRNIIINLKDFKKNPSLKLNTKLTAAIIAAGPTLDYSIEKLKQNRTSYYIITTDTAYSTLIKYGIAPDLVVSVDAQQVSVTHFYDCPINNGSNDKTYFIFDICTNPAIPSYVRNKGYPVFFFHSGHPLSQLASEYAALPYVETGAGTVTIACCDTARLAGFKKIELFGADFAYSHGKPYTKGTYLETQFMTSATRIIPQEMKFTALMYRTPLQKKENSSEERAFVSDVLQRYEKTLFYWAEKHGYKKNLNLMECKSQPQTTQLSESRDFNFKSFIEKWINGLSSKKYEETLLPYIAFLQSKKCKNISIFELYNLAYKNAIRYNKWI
ncbi:MAG: DUF115 domain-containing protein [Treponema sp.]|nr:DUF115 domain-containing protein [Treponema sp.]